MAEKLSRRDLFSIFRRSVDTAVKPPTLPTPLRPPSAVGEAAIADSCYRCGACVEICPRHAIKPLPLDMTLEPAQETPVESAGAVS